MQKNKQTNMLKSVMAGGFHAGTARVGAQQKHPQEHVPGPHAAAPVVFGQWQQAVEPCRGLPFPPSRHIPRDLPRAAAFQRRHVRLDQGQQMMIKTERVIWGEPLFNVYPDRR
jgi:hypothetical protein